MMEINKEKLLEKLNDLQNSYEQLADVSEFMEEYFLGKTQACKEIINIIENS